MALFDQLLPVLPRLNAISGTLGANKFAVVIRSTTATSNQDRLWGRTTGLDSDDVQILEDGQNPAVEFLREEALALGLPDDSLIRVGPITPSHTGGGYTPETLRGNGASVTYVVTGPGMTNVDFQLYALDTSDPLAYFLTLKRT